MTMSNPKTDLDVDLTSLSVAELVALKQQCDEKSQDIRAQIAQEDMKAGGRVVVDPVWRRRASDAARHAGRLSVRIQNELTNRKEVRRAQAQFENERQQKRFERAFVRAAKSKLDDSTFAELCRLASETIAEPEADESTS